MRRGVGVVVFLIVGKREKACMTEEWARESEGGEM